MVTLIKLKVFIIFIIILFNYGTAHSQAVAYNKNFVPNKKTAILVAEAIWIPIYGDKVKLKKPFIATLIGDSIWIVEGTLPKGRLGGVPYIALRKRDCKILEVTHSK